jgi:ThiF family/Prokaryotic homologs of the JAB domain
MSIPVTLSMTGDQHRQLNRLLFPGDGKEAVAIALCGRRDGLRRHRLLVRELSGIPPEGYSERASLRVTWSPESMEGLLERAAAQRLSVIKIHCHPSGYAAFSETDDKGDKRLLPMVCGWVEADVPHGSAVMLPDGRMFGRVLGADGAFAPIATINVVGDNLEFWYADGCSTTVPDFAASHAQIFDEGTIERLQRLSAAVIGNSGTGSPMVEQLMRLGVGEIVLVDDDVMEDRNVNRILNSTMDDVRKGRYKVDVLGDAVERAGLGTKVIRLRKNLWDPEVVRAVAECDVVFGCMDTVDGRYLLNALATYYIIPYFDIGVRLDTFPEGPRKGHVREVCGTINYIQPGRSSLMSRGLFMMKQVAEAGLRRNDPSAHVQQVRDGYIAEVEARRPAVISVNMLGASLAANELLARLHPFREEQNAEYASVIFSLSSMEMITEAEEGRCELLGSHVGAGDTRPLLGQIELSEKGNG